MAKKKSPDLVRLDSSFTNAFGVRSKYGHGLVNGNYYVSQDVLQSMYIHNGFARAICDVPAEEMTRAGFTIEGEDITEDDKRAIQSRLEELDAFHHLSEAIKWRRAFGGGMIVLGINDSGELDEPLNEEGIQDIEFLRTYDRFEAYPAKRYDDPKSSKFGEVELWQIQPKDIQPYLVHESRVLVFDGESVPNYVRYSNKGWGASSIQACIIQLKRLDSAYQYANLLLERMQQAVHGIPNLSTIIGEPDGETQVAKRVDTVDRVRGALNTIVIDAEETYEIKSLSLTGAQEILDRDAEALAAVSRIPVYVLMTRSPGGLNATGATNQDAWHAQVASWQNDQMRKQCDRLVSLLRLADSDGSTDGGEYTLKFNPLSTPGEIQQVEIDLKKEQAAKTKMEMFSGYMTAGVMDQDEVREQIRDEFELEGDAPEPEEDPIQPMVLNPGQKIVDPTPGQSNPAPVGTK